MGTDLTKNYGDKAMFTAEDMPHDDQGRVLPQVRLLSATADPLGAIAATCRMYEGGVTRTLSDITNEQRRHYWEQVKKTHLKAPLEFVDLHFMLEGVTRSFTHQMVRQRTAVYAQESLRFAVKDDMAADVALPPSLMDDGQSNVFKDPSEQDLATSVWQGALDGVQDAYDTLINMGVPAEDARGLLPHNITTRLHYKTNLRNLIDHAGNRLCTQAQFEWRMVFAGIVDAIRNYGDGNWQFQLMADDGLFKPICYALGHCPFTADFDRGCTIRDRVQKGEFDKIDDAEWLMDPAAARRG